MQEYIALSLFRIDLPSVGQYGRGCRQYIPPLTSHSVNKSIVLDLEKRIVLQFQYRKTFVLFEKYFVPDVLTVSTTEPRFFEWADVNVSFVIFFYQIPFLFLQ